MAWRRARSLIVLEDEIQQVAPGTTVWDIGDASHRASWSDHNPNECCDVVCAIDVLDNAGLDLGWLVDTIIATDPPALKYVIYRDRIWFPQTGWQPYHGAYHSHVHVSVGWGPDGRSTGPYDDESPWGLAAGGDELIGLKEGDEGQRVRALQGMLNRAGHRPEGDLDGIWGPLTTDAVYQCRRSVGSGVSRSGATTITGAAYAQIQTAVARQEAEAAANQAAKEVKRAADKAIADLVANLPSTGADLPSHIVLDLPDSITVPVQSADDDEGGE